MEEDLPLLQEILFEFYLNDAELVALLVGSLGLEEVEFGLVAVAHDIRKLIAVKGAARQMVLA